MLQEPEQPIRPVHHAVSPHGLRIVVVEVGQVGKEEGHADFLEVDDVGQLEALWPEGEIKHYDIHHLAQNLLDGGILKRLSVFIFGAHY